MKALGYLAAGRSMADLFRYLGVAKSTITHLKKKAEEVGELMAATNQQTWAKEQKTDLLLFWQQCSSD